MKIRDDESSKFSDLETVYALKLPQHLLYQQVFKETDVKRRACLKCTNGEI
jgi:hypothetical protein